jgi:hypothetical protein
MEKFNHYIFVIDTDSYAGNFERDMCAYITGQVGECGVGEEQAQVAIQEVPNIVKNLEGIVKNIPDENGCSRPASIFENPQYGNDGFGKQALLTEKNKKKYPFPAYNSVAIYLNSIPPRELLDVMKERAKRFATQPLGYKQKQKIEIEGFRLFKVQTLLTELSE